jgi:hypothetical protein
MARKTARGQGSPRQGISGCIRHGAEHCCHSLRQPARASPCQVPSAPIGYSMTNENAKVTAMRRLDWVDITAKTLGILCAIAILGGGVSLILGSSGTLLIWTGERLKPCQRTFRHMGFYGGLFCGGGLLVVGTAGAIAQYLEEKVADADLLEPWQRQLSRTGTPTSSVCPDCHQYHGQSYGGNFLVCGMHPCGWSEGHCPDFMPGKPLNPTEDRFL